MKKIKILFTALLLSGAVWAQGQTPQPEAAPALEAAPPALAEPEKKQAIPAEMGTPAPAVFNRKPQFSLSMGSQFSRFGQAAYLQPTVSFPVTRRFQAFGSVQFLNTFGPAFYHSGSETGSFGASSRQQQSYMVMAGGNYAFNEKLNITGSIWRDFSNYQGLSPLPVSLFSPAGTQGMTLRAHYKINDRFSVSGGIRYGNGRGYNAYSPHFSPDYTTPFGF